MPKVHCATLDCEFCDLDKYICKAKEIKLSDHSIMTLWEGRQHFNRCKTYRESQYSKDIKKRLEPLMRGINGNNKEV